MGFIIGGGSSSGGGGLPDYSLTPILYPRKWIKGRDVEEVYFFVEITAFDQGIIFLGSTMRNEILVPIEICVSVFDKNTMTWDIWQDWHIFKNSSSWNLGIINSESSLRYFSGVLKFSKTRI